MQPIHCYEQPREFKAKFNHQKVKHFLLKNIFNSRDHYIRGMHRNLIQNLYSLKDKDGNPSFTKYEIELITNIHELFDNSNSGDIFITVMKMLLFPDGCSESNLGLDEFQSTKEISMFAIACDVMDLEIKILPYYEISLIDTNIVRFIQVNIKNKKKEVGENE